MTTDLLTDLLRLTRAECRLSGRLVAGGHWGRRFANLDAVKFCAAVDGGSWFMMEGGTAPARFECGDVLIMNGARSLVLASEPQRLAGAVTTPLAQDEHGNYRLGQGDEFVMVSGMVQIDASHQPLLLGGLPPLIHVKGTQPEAASLGWLLNQIVGEMTPPHRPGGPMVLTDLAQLLFVLTLRTYVMQAPPADGGWLRALGDKRLAPVLASMHADPAREWRLAALAQRAGMSRTAFAVHFRQVMGVPPLAYLTNWRMHVAERDLRAGVSVTEVAAAVGYTSESAFSHAFKRATGVAPGQYRKQVEGKRTTAL